MGKISPARRIFSIFFGVLFCLVLIVSIFWIPVQKVLLQPDVYKQALQDQGFYRVYPQMVTGLLFGETSSSMLGNSLNQITSRLDQEKVDQFIFSMIPPTWFQDQLNANLDRVFAFLNGSGETLSLGVDLGGIKTNLAEEGNIRGLIQLLPECTASDLTSLLSLLGGEKNIPFCRFPDSVVGVVYPIIQPIVMNMIAQIPDSIPLTSVSLESNGSPTALVTFVQIARNASTIGTTLAILGILLLVAMILISGPGWKAKIQTTGIVLLSAGSAGLVMLLILWLGLNSSAAAIVHAAVSYLPGEVGGVITGVYLQVANNYVMVAALIGFGILVLGVVLYVVSRTLFKDHSVAGPSGDL
jgi:hypothetical protein